MTDFLQHLQEQRGNHRDAAIAFLASLRQRGIFVNPANVPKFVHCKLEGLDTETTKQLIRRVVAPNFEHADEMLVALADSGYSMECTDLLRDPVIFGRNIDHERTLAHLRENYSDLRGESSSFERAQSYLTYLQNQGVALRGQDIRRVLPNEHSSVLKDVEQTIKLSLDFDLPIRVCRAPGWVEGIHPHKSRFNIAGTWYFNLEASYEKAILGEGRKATDHICPDCRIGLGIDSKL